MSANPRTVLLAHGWTREKEFAPIAAYGTRISILIFLPEGLYAQLLSLRRHFSAYIPTVFPRDIRSCLFHVRENLKLLFSPVIAAILLRSTCNRH